MFNMQPHCIAILPCLALPETAITMIMDTRVCPYMHREHSRLKLSLMEAVFEIQMHVIVVYISPVHLVDHVNGGIFTMTLPHYREMLVN